MGTQKGLIFGSFPCDSWDFLRDLAGEALTVIAADGGMACAEAAGFVPRVYVGDGDSGGKARPDMETVSLPAQKDLTDLQAAWEWARDHDLKELVFTACTGGRQDHHLAALQLLETAKSEGVAAEIRDPLNRILFLSDETVSVFRSHWKYFSLIPVDRVLHGVTIRGAKYPLHDATVHRGDSLTVSNEWLEEEAQITVDGCCYLIMSN